MNQKEIILNNFVSALPYILLILSFVKMISLLADYQVVWAHPENNVKREIILLDKNKTISSAFLQAFNWPVIEAGAPRLTRFFSSIMDITDAHFRSWFHNKVFPHPSISISWIFILILSPYFVYRIFHYTNLSKQVSIFGVAIYLSLAGPLSLTVMNFRAGKAAALFFIIYIIYLMVRKSSTLIEQKNSNLKISCYILLIYFFSLFTDEIAVFSLATIFIFQRYKNKFDFALPLSAAAITLFYYYLIKYFLPVLHDMAGFPITCAGHCLEGEYDMMKNFISIVTLKHDINYYLELLNIIYYNALYGIRDLSGISLIWSTEAHEKALGIFTLIALSFIVVLYSYKFFHNSIVSPASDNQNYRILFPVALLMAAALLMHGLLMSLTRHHLWGIYWYGVFVSVPFLLLITHLFSHITSNKTSVNLLIYVTAILLVTSNFINFKSTNYAYKDYHYYPIRARQLPDVFTFKDNKFQLYNARFNRYNLQELTSDFLKLGNGSQKITLPSELHYLITEINICPWEFDYYYIFDKSTTHFTTTCYSTFLPELRHKLLQLSQHINNDNENISKMIGLYDADGYDNKRMKAYLSINENGETYVVNGKGGYANIEVRDYNIFSSTWNLRGTYNPIIGQITWENGSVWIKNNELPVFK